MTRGVGPGGRGNGSAQLIDGASLVEASREMSKRVPCFDDAGASQTEAAVVTPVASASLAKLAAAAIASGAVATRCTISLYWLTSMLLEPF